MRISPKRYVSRVPRQVHCDNTDSGVASYCICNKNGCKPSRAKKKNPALNFDHVNLHTSYDTKAAQPRGVTFYISRWCGDHS